MSFGTTALSEPSNVKFAKISNYIGGQNFTVLELLLENPFNSTLKAHKLRGKLDGMWACWVEYDCRIIDTFESGNNFESELEVHRNQQSTINNQQKSRS